MSKLSPGSFVATYRSLAGAASRALGGLAIGAILAQWAVETGWGSSALAGRHNLAGIRYYGATTGGVPATNVGGFAGFRSLADFVTAYEHEMRLPYYRAVVGANNVDTACRALGASPWDAGHYTDGDQKGGSLLSAYALMEAYLAGGPTAGPVAEFVTYIVRAGDTLIRIAAKYRTTWERIYADNRTTIGGNPGLIRPGQKLRIRKAATVAKASAQWAWTDPAPAVVLPGAAGSSAPEATHPAGGTEAQADLQPGVPAELEGKD